MSEREEPYSDEPPRPETSRGEVSDGDASPSGQSQSPGFEGQAAETARSARALRKELAWLGAPTRARLWAQTGVAVAVVVGSAIGLATSDSGDRNVALWALALFLGAAAVMASAVAWRAESRYGAELVSVARLPTGDTAGQVASDELTRIGDRRRWRTDG
jgi:hypothetical protein